VAVVYWLRLGTAMAKLLQRYLSFDGRLARLPFFIRNIYLGVAVTVIFVVAIPLFAAGGIYWWLGMLDVMAGIALFAVGETSLMVRRLHDLGLCGYHAIWVGAAEAGWIVLSYGPPRVMFLGLPLAAICLWLLFWPGRSEANRFGERCRMGRATRNPSSRSEAA
jgi:uncharacterized membrane protein YhaH (DUF805 family)